MKHNLLLFTKLLLVGFCMFLASKTYAQTATPPSAGDGTESSPYEISSLENLYWLSQNNAEWNKYFVQTADIDATATTGWDSSKGFSSIGNTDNRFKGSYDGGGFIISNLYINRPSISSVGLFGIIDSIASNIENLGLTDITIVGNKAVGGIAGYIINGNVTNCYTTGTVSGNNTDNWWVAIGGIVGINRGDIKFSYSSVNVTSTQDDMVGGLIGWNYGLVQNSYCNGNVKGRTRTGGLVGNNSGTIEKCYSSSRLDAGTPKGGIVGYEESGSTVINSFWDYEAVGYYYTAGEGTRLTTEQMRNKINFLNAGWDFHGETTNGSDDIWAWNKTDNSGYPFLSWQTYEKSSAPFSNVQDIVLSNITTDQMTLESYTISYWEGNPDGFVVYMNTEDNFIDPNDGDEPTANLVWQNTGQQCIYFGTSDNPNVTITNLDKNKEYYFKIYAYNDISDTETYENQGCVTSKYTNLEYTVPSGEGTVESPYVISNLEELTWLMYSDTAWNKNFIQTADIDASTTSTWFENSGFSPIGNDDIKFTGSYNGKSHQISNLYINKPSTDAVGFFGFIESASTQIDSLNILNADITGSRYCGIITGRIIAGKILNSSSSGTIKSEIRTAGGIAGHSKDATIKQCYSNANVTAVEQYAGGLVGYQYRGSIENGYSIGQISSYKEVGGLVGKIYYGTVTNCYSRADVTGTMDRGAIVGRVQYGTIKNTFFDVNVTGSSFGTGLTTAEMKEASAFLDAGWDFINDTINGTNDYWGINATENNGFPFLAIQGYESDEIACQAPFSPIKSINTELFIDSIAINSLNNSGYFNQGCAIYINSINEFTVPENGTEPTANTVWQNGGQQCVYFGTSSEPKISITGLNSNEKYYIKVYSYNICSDILYETTGYLKECVTKISYNVPNGDGSVENPYEIETLENLAWLMYADTAWSDHFIQVASIDASSTSTWDDNKGFLPIGEFGGSYNGKGFVIDQLHINRPGETSSIGLFEYLTSEGSIDSLGVTNADVRSDEARVGILVGTSSGTIKNCYTSGASISTDETAGYVGLGGLVGMNYGRIDYCYSIADVTRNKDEHAGGLVGYNTDDGIITNSYAGGDVTSTNNSGGFVGMNQGIINYCYSYGSVNNTRGTDYGFLGERDGGSVYKCYWNKQTSGATSSIAGTGITTEQMQNIVTFLNAGWDFIDETANGVIDIWGINSTDNNGFPFLEWQGFTNDCQAPLSPASNIIIEDVEFKSLKLASYTEAGYGTDGYAVYVNTVDSWSIPEDGTTPDTNSVWQNSGQQCVYFGQSNEPNILVKELSPCEEYFIKVFAYNICEDTEIYEQTGVVIGVESRDTVPVPNADTLEVLTGQCSVTVNTTPTATIHCTDNITGTTTDPLEYTEQGTYTITWSYDDGEGNVSTQKQTVIVDDTEAPVVAVSELSTISAQCSVTITDMPTATDNCLGEITGTTTDPLEYTEQGTYTITWSYDDGNDNVTTQKQTVVVDDTEAPVVAVSELSTISAQCSVTITDMPTATDNCSGEITGSTTDPLEYAEQGTYTITWSYDDGNDNVTTQKQTVIVDDTEAPVAAVSELSTIEGQCSVTITDMPTATDNCSGEITGTTTDPLEYTEQGTYIITWSYDDGNDNVITQKQTVIVDDTEAPVVAVSELSTISAQCSVTITDMPTATDNCSGEITGTTTDPLEYTEQGTYTITWSYDDGNDNVSTQKQTVIVNDDTKPTISCIDNQTKEIAASETVYEVVGAEFDPSTTDDNCAVDSFYNDFNNLSTLQGAELSVGTTTITWLIVDVNGNTNECSFDVTVNKATGIGTLESNGIAVYPNPVSDKLLIDIDNQNVNRVEIYDLAGKLLYQNIKVSESEEVDFTNFESGVYLLSIITKDSKITQKIIKK